MGAILTTKSRRARSDSPACRVGSCITARGIGFSFPGPEFVALEHRAAAGCPLRALRDFVVKLFPFMAQTKHQIEALLAEAGSNGPRHRFGQNFMIDQNLVRLVAEAGRVGRGELVIEVGPGTGTLTEELLERADEVAVVEIDRDLAAMLGKRF